MIMEKKTFYHYDNLREKTDENGRLVIHAIENLKQKQLYFSDPTEFKDKFDCKVYLDNRGTREQWIEELCKNGCTNKQAIDTVKGFKIIGDLVCPTEDLKTINVSRVCCFTEKKDSTKLWSEYGDDHSGICLCFRIEKAAGENNDFSLPLYMPKSGKNPVSSGIFKKIDYTYNGIPVINRFDNPHHNANIVGNQMYTKLPELYYEYEWRIVNGDNPKDGLMEYYDGFFDGVIFGSKISPEKAKLVYEAIKKNYTDSVNFYRATEITGEKIQIVKIPNIEEYIKGISM